QLVARAWLQRELATTEPAQRDRGGLGDRGRVIEVRDQLVLRRCVTRATERLEDDRLAGARARHGADELGRDRAEILRVDVVQRHREAERRGSRRDDARIAIAERTF